MNLYEKAEKKIAELEANIAGYIAAGATVEKGKELRKQVEEIFNRIVDGDKSAHEDLYELSQNSDYSDDPSYRLVQDQPELEGLKRLWLCPWQSSAAPSTSSPTMTRA